MTDTRSMLECMMLIRAYEQKNIAQQVAGKGPGTCTSVGQEASAVGVVRALAPQDKILTNHRSAGHPLARGADPAKLMAETYGRATGYCKGKSGTLHISVKELGVILTSTIVGGELSLATGVGLSLSMQKTDAIAACIFGDGAACEGVFHESLNLADVWQLPVLYVCENNPSGRPPSWRGERRCSSSGSRPGPPRTASRAKTVDGNDVDAVSAAAREAASYVRETRKPFLLETYTYRMRGHYEPDDQAYVDASEIAQWRTKDPIEAAKTKAPRARRDHARRGPRNDGGSSRARDRRPSGQVRRRIPLPGSRRAAHRRLRVEDIIMATISTVDAIGQALAEEMRRDETVVMFGEGVATKRQDLVKEFGGKRVRNTPLAEGIIAGTAAGAAATGLRPIIDLLFSPFLCYAMEEIVNSAGKLPLHLPRRAVRLPHGRDLDHGLRLDDRRPAQPQHRIVVRPRPGVEGGHAVDACRVQGAAQGGHPRRQPGHVLHRCAAHARPCGEVPDGEHVVPIGKAAIRRSGTDVTLVSYGKTVDSCLKAATTLEAEGISAEVIDLRTVKPLDEAAVLGSVQKTGRIVIVHEASRTCGIGAEVAATVAEKAFGALKGPIVRLTGPDTPAPSSYALEQAFVPQPDQIVTAARKLRA